MYTVVEEKAVKEESDREWEAVEDGDQVVINWQDTSGKCVIAIGKNIHGKKVTDGFIRIH